MTITKTNQMNKLIHFKDGNGHIDISNRIIGRWVWNDWEPFAQWMVKWTWEWTATDLYGLTDDEWETVFVLSSPNPNTRTLEQKIADDLYWKGKMGFRWHNRQQQIEQLPKRDNDYTIKI